MAVLSNVSPVYVALRFVLLYSLLSLETSATNGISTASVSGLLPPYDALYYLGVRAYFEKDWEKAAELIEKSIETRETILRRRRECHDNCGAAGHDRLEKLDTEKGSVWDLWAIDWVQRRAECIRFCLGRTISPAGQLSVSTDIQYEFDTRNPYNYLQVTYYKLGKIQKAVPAAQTFFVANPSHLEMRNNIEKYKRMPGVTDEAFHDRERDGNQQWYLYDAALLAESSGEWARAAEVWRKCVNETLKQTEECRAQCEVEGQGIPDEEISKTTRVFEKAAVFHLLSCKQSCVAIVSTRPGRISPVEDFLPTVLEHLHIAQFKAGDLRGAVQTLRSLLLFYPSDSDSLSNLQLYFETLGGDTEAQEAQPNQEISTYVNRSLLEKSLLYFGVENLEFNFTDPDLWTPEEVVPESLRDVWRAEREKLNEKIKEGEKDVELDDSGFYAGGTVPLVGVTITMDDDMLNGTNRVVLDGVLSQPECDKVLQLAATAASLGDGYRGRRSPHTPHEKFEGLTVLKALNLAQDGFVNQTDARLLHEIGERVRTLLHSYFRSPSALYFSFTHLVCRSAITGKQEGRLDLSHPVHVDNCLLEPETRHALLYLNEDFEGGDLFFTDRDAKTVSATVRPKCGRVVGFSSGPVNPHGVTAVTAGRRCALALWFTKEKLHRDMEREEAEAAWAKDGVSVTREKEEAGASTPARSGRSQSSRERGKVRGRVVGARDEL
ncbi:hypothetical protein COCON_G00004360 [Conger conger]|uniref:procollagen-proline 3-dioxygenase n=1 Tax=Conger conger TaxID=82655 RepID=A0A9Q1E186_CONCO|nr:hypothetical protein COCON_G00004360 [Conger conger]